jgi:hypothetical protein
VKPLWSWRQTVDVTRRFSDAISLRHESSSQMASHFACWLNIESMTWTNASYEAKKPCLPVRRYPSSIPSSVVSESISTTRPSGASCPPSASSGNVSASHSLRDAS